MWKRDPRAVNVKLDRQSILVLAQQAGHGTYRAENSADLRGVGVWLLELAAALREIEQSTL